MNNFLSNRPGQRRLGVVGLLAAVSAAFPVSGMVSNDDARMSMSMESIDTPLNSGVVESLRSQQSNLDRAWKEAFDNGLSIASEEAALVGALVGANPGEYLRTGNRYEESALAKFNGVSKGSANVVIGGTQSTERSQAFEAYDNRENRATVAFTASYNATASRQLDAGELFYPTVVVAPNQYGYTVNNRLVFSFDALTRSATGALSSFNRRNIIKALIDASVLATDQTKLIPVYRDGTGGTADSRANFATGLTAYDVITADKETVKTSALAVGKSFDLLALSQTNVQMASGVADQTEAIDTLRLAAVYIKLFDGTTTKYVKFDTSALPTSDFNAATQGNSRKLQLNFDTSDLPLAQTTQDVAGVVVAMLSPLGTNTARINVVLNASAVQDTGVFNSSAATLTLVSLTDASGVAQSLTGVAGAALSAILSTSSVVGFDVTGYKSNSNRRSRGKLLDFQSVNYLYTVPLLPPLAMARPMMSDDSNDGQLLADLVSATRFQTANAFVTELLRAQATLAQYASQPDTATVSPHLFGAASDLVAPAYASQPLDVATSIDSRTTTERTDDLKALLINKVRSMAFDLYIKSGYGPALEAMYPGQNKKPVVMITCDPVIANYMQINGETRLLGDLFDYKIAPTFDSRMAGQLVFSFGIEEALGSGVPTVLHFGNMAWRSELTAILPQTRNNAQSMELTVQPSYRHVTNLPIMGVVTITNLSSVTSSKVSVNMHSV